MPYGVTGGPATFHRVMNSILAPLLRNCVIVFIDDILIYSKTWERHLEHVAGVFRVLQEHRFKIKLSKCSFARQELPYLGHIISAKVVATDLGKVKIVQNWPIPTSVIYSEVSLVWLGTIGNLCSILALLLNLLKIY